MRILSVILFFAFSPMYLSAQPSSAKPKTPETFGPYYNQIGADLLPAIITGGGGELGHYQIEALYREHQPNGDLRIKIEINNKNYFEGFTPYPDQLLPGSTLENQRYQQNEIVPRASTLVSLGRSTYRYSQRLPIYLGADA
ncbi:MAG: hypothetical protein KI786_00555 [Mameliella sp.]|nr:hypothetical protein [Phaeodactylibacter sp.]